jgi:hypothetical protein
VLIPVILDDDVSIGIGHVGPPEELPTRVADVEIELGFGQTAIHEQQAQQRLGSRLRADADSSGRSASGAAARRARASTAEAQLFEGEPRARIPGVEDGGVEHKCVSDRDDVLLRQLGGEFDEQRDRVRKRDTPPYDGATDVPVPDHLWPSRSIVEHGARHVDPSVGQPRKRKRPENAGGHVAEAFTASQERHVGHREIEGAAGRVCAPDAVEGALEVTPP